MRTARACRTRAPPKQLVVVPSYARAARLRPARLRRFVRRARRMEGGTDAGGGSDGAFAAAAPAYLCVEPRGDKFVASARVAGRRVFLPGVWDSAAEAARASDRAHLLAGAAPLNFGAESYAAEQLAPLAAGLSPDALVKAVKAAAGAPRSHGRTSRFRGVTLTKERSWQPELRLGDATVTLGVYADEADAARAYDRACVMLGRPAANFPRDDYPDAHPLPAGADVAAALRAAFQPRQRSSAFVGTSARKAGALGRGKAPAGPRWEAYIKVDGRKLSLGLHASEAAAARSYDRAHLLLRGAAVNFPAHEYAAENLPRLTLGPGALSGDALRAALKARAVPPGAAAAGDDLDDDDDNGGEDDGGEGLPRKRARLAAAPKYRGVSLRKAAGGGGEPRWEAYVKLHGRKTALGVHASEAAAARAHDVAMLVLCGCARNFPADSYAADVASGRLARRSDVTADELRTLAAPRWEAHPTLLGVTRTRIRGAGDDDDAMRWRAQLTVDGAALRWGTGADAAAAGLAYDVARVCLRGCPANAAPHDPRLSAVPRAPAELRGEALRAFVAAAVHDAFRTLGMAHAIVEAPAAPGAAEDEGGGGDEDDDDDEDMGPEEQLLLDSDDRDREDPLRAD